MQNNDHELLSWVLLEYANRVQEVAKKQWFEVLLSHSIFDPRTEDVITGGLSSIQKSDKYTFVAFLQQAYISRIYDKNYKK